MNPLTVQISAEDADFIPMYKTEGSACMDCRADVISTIRAEIGKTEDVMYIEPDSIRVIDLGFRVAVPEGHVMNIYIRSGLAAAYGLSMVTGVGKIDSDYRGIVKAIVINHSQHVVEIKHKDRIAQCEIVPIPAIEFESVPILDETSRGEGGLGSTGVQ